MTSWGELLDAIDEGLSSSPPVLVDFAPGEIGPLPADLRNRAERTLHRMADVEAALEHDRAELARELAAISAVTASASTPRFLDTKA